MATTPAQIGVVLTQSPAVVAPAASVACTHPTLTVGSGVPDYTFLTTDAAGDPILVLDDTTTDPVTDGALSLLNDFGLVSSVTWVDQTTTPDVDLGYVISTLPAPGAFVTPGQAITVYGAGYKVPNLVGMTVVNAQAAITALGATKLTNGTITGTGGTVTSQSPAAFTVVAPGTAVNLVGAK
jgi:beta-lactam-binding protein with PASTA domain